MIEKKNTLLSIAVALALTACGGGGSTPAPLATSSGKAVDGYLGGASALCDTNNNGVVDAGETTTTTTSLGDFVFSPACSSTIVISGGTNIDTGLPFKGLLKASAGSTVATPLTSLMVSGGLTAAQVAAALSLPPGTDVSKIDPMTNADLQKKTLAMQQIIQQIADTLGSLAQNTSPAAIQAIYSEVAKAVVATLAANPTTKLVEANGNVSASLVFGIVQQSVKNLAATADTTLATVKASIGAYSPKSVAELISGAIATEAETLAKASDAALLGLAKSLQSNPTIANAASQLATLLTTANDSKVDLTKAGIALQQLSDTDTSNDATASATVLSEVATQCQQAGIPVPVVDVSTWSQPTNYLGIQNDSIELNGNVYTLSQFLTGVTLTQKPAPIDTVGFAFDVKGTPIPKNANGVMTTKVSLGMELTDTGASGRVLQFILDQADVSVDSNKQLAVSVPAGAKLYVYGKTSNGTNANLTLANITADQFIAAGATNKLTFNAGKVLDRILTEVQAQPASPTQSVFSSLQNVKGKFNMTVAVSNLNIHSQTNGTVKGLSVSVTGSGQPAVTGLGVQGIFTVP